MASVEVVEDRRGALGRDPVEPADLVVLPPWALRDLETVLLVDRLRDELGICHRAAPPSPFGGFRASLFSAFRRVEAEVDGRVVERAPALSLRVPVRVERRARDGGVDAVRVGQLEPELEVLRDQVEREERRESRSRRGGRRPPRRAGSASAARASRPSRPSAARRARPGSIPSRLATAHDSAIAAIVAPAIRLLQSFAAWPAPWPPTRTTSLPSVSKSGRARAKGRLVPADHDRQRRVLRAARAAAHGRVEDVELPALRREPSRERGRARGHVDEERPRARAVARTPCSPRTTSSTAAGVGSESRTASAAAAASAGVAATAAPSASARAGSRSQPTTSCPAATR